MRTLARSCTKCDTAEVVKVAFIRADWQAHNGHGWYADSAVSGFSANCPSGPIR
jgi:hypothetical protein